MRIENAGVIEQNVEATECSHGFIDRAAAFGRLANVGAQEDGLTAVFENLCSNSVASAFVATRDRDPSAFLGKENGCSFANA